MQKIFKGISITDLAPLAIVFVVIAFTISMGSSILTDLGTGQCEDEGYTWEADTCWSTYNATDGCTTQALGCAEFGDYAINASLSGNESMETLGDWLPTLALVVIAAVIIGVLMFYLGGAARSGGR